jgi:hypothetical protein
MTVDLKVVAQVLKKLKHADMIDGYWNIKEALQTVCNLTEAQANELFGEPTDTGEIK